MKQTTNLGLKKPDLEDYVNVADLNDNADIIDTAITTEKEKLTTHLADIMTQAEPNKIPRALASGKLDLGWIPKTGWSTIASVTPTSTVTQVDFENLNLDEYRELSIVFLLSNLQASSSGSLIMRFNDDVGNNYGFVHYILSGSYTRTQTHIATGITFSRGVGSTSNPTLGEILISNTALEKKIKSTLSQNSYGDYQALSGTWSNPAKINKISFFGTLKAGSHITLLGVK